MLSLITTILGFLPTLSNTINKVTEAISNERIARINAQTDEEKAYLDERIKTLEAKRDVLVADVGHSNWDLGIRVLFSLAPAFYLGKILVWDKALGLGSSGDLSDNGWWYVTSVVGFYFVSEAGKSIVKTFKS